MPGQIGEAYFVLDARIDALERALRKAEQRAEKASQTIANKLGSVGDKLSRMGTRLTLAISAPIAAGAAAAVKFASDLVETENLLLVTFDQVAERAKATAQAVATATGYSTETVERTLGRLGLLFQQMGASQSDALRGATMMMMRLLDITSLYNVSMEEALIRIQSGLLGETEAVRRLGVTINEDAIKRYAVLMGVIDNTNEKLTQQQKFFLRAAKIVHDTAKAHGDLGRTMGSTANQFRIAREQLKEMAVRMGALFIPLATKMAAVIIVIAKNVRKWAEAWAELSPKTKAIIAGIVGIMVAVGPIAKVFGAAIKAVRGLAIAFGILQAMANAAGGGVVGVVAATLAAATAAAAAGAAMYGAFRLIERGSDAAQREMEDALRQLDSLSGKQKDMERTLAELAKAQDSVASSIEQYGRASGSTAQQVDRLTEALREQARAARDAWAEWRAAQELKRAGLPLDEELLSRLRDYYEASRELEEFVAQASGTWEDLQRRGILGAPIGRQWAAATSWRLRSLWQRQQRAREAFEQAYKQWRERRMEAAAEVLLPEDEYDLWRRLREVERHFDDIKKMYKEDLEMQRRIEEAKRAEIAKTFKEWWLEKTKQIREMRRLAASNLGFFEVRGLARLGLIGGEAAVRRPTKEAAELLAAWSPWFKSPEERDEFFKTKLRDAMEYMREMRDYLRSIAERGVPYARLAP